VARARVAGKRSALQVFFKDCTSSIELDYFDQKGTPNVFQHGSQAPDRRGLKENDATAIAAAENPASPSRWAIADAGANLILLERMDGGAFSLPCTRHRQGGVSAYRFPHRPTSARGAQARSWRRCRAPPGAAPRPRQALYRWMGGLSGDPVEGECIGGVGVSGGNFSDGTRGRANRVIDRAAGERSAAMASAGGRMCLRTRSAFRQAGIVYPLLKGRKAQGICERSTGAHGASYDEVPCGQSVAGIINTDAQQRSLETTRRGGAPATRLPTSRSPIPSPTGAPHTEPLPTRRVSFPVGYHGVARASSAGCAVRSRAGYSPRVTPNRTSAATGPQNRLGILALPQAEGMPGGVMLPYRHPLQRRGFEYLIGRSLQVNARVAQVWCLAGENPESPACCSITRTARCPPAHASSYALCLGVLRYGMNVSG